MPAYSFKARFVDLIKNGQKKQTIRAPRKGQARPGSPLYLYYGMRTKQCTKLLETVCTKIETIEIWRTGEVFIQGARLTDSQRDKLARVDGFKDWKDMQAFWLKENSLPFYGDIIHW